MENEKLIAITSITDVVRLLNKETANEMAE